MGHSESAKNIAQELSQKADNSYIKFSIGCFQLSSGDFAQGILNYEHIYNTPQHREKKRFIPLPQKLSIAHLKGRRLLLTPDQGLGDQIRSSRHFLSLDASCYAKLWVACDSRLIDLFSNSFPHIKFIREDKICADWVRSEGFDIELKHASAANLEQRQEFTPINNYLSCDIDDVHPSLSNTKKDNKPIIGLCWRSVVDNPSRQHWYYPLAHYAKALRGKNIQVVALQNHVTEEERKIFEANAGFPLEILENFDTKDDLSSLTSTAKNLDLALSTATATADLLGACGVPTILVAKRLPERWYLGEPYLKQYYPNMTPVVLNMNQDWSEADAPLKHNIEQLLAQSAERSTP